MIAKISLFLTLFLFCSNAIVQYSEAQWMARLGSERYKVMRQKGTEKAFSGAYLHEWRNGSYLCAACECPLFDSKDKYEELGSGWVSFCQPINAKSVFYEEDWRLPFKRYEVLCRSCRSHLGHVFHDGPPPKQLRFTINSIALLFVLQN